MNFISGPYLKEVIGRFFDLEKGQTCIFHHISSNLCKNGQMSA